jgi:hypothetical protein
VKSYQFLDASGRAMEKFVKGTTESIRRDVQWNRGCADFTRRLQLRSSPRYAQGGRP